MSSRNPQKSPYSAIGPDMWLRGTRLGIVMLVMFGVGAALAFGLLTVLTSMDATNRVFWSIFIGPVLGLGVMVAVWVYRLPKAEDPESDD